MAEIELSEEAGRAMLAIGWATVAEDGILELTPLGSQCLRAYCHAVLAEHEAELSRFDTDYDVPAAKCDQDHTTKP